MALTSSMHVPSRARYRRVFASHDQTARFQSEYDTCVREVQDAMTLLEKCESQPRYSRLPHRVQHSKPNTLGDSSQLPHTTVSNLGTRRRTSELLRPRWSSPTPIADSAGTKSSAGGSSYNGASSWRQALILERAG